MINQSATNTFNNFGQISINKPNMIASIADTVKLITKTIMY